ncbi:hypothetical protein B0H19DRAFT_1084517 [Mycena capillaripes]|nr:hypothetical protein B0H19DRAFT_1084517 [Mycena capillaripes]
MLVKKGFVPGGRFRIKGNRNENMPTGKPTIVRRSQGPNGFERSQNPREQADKEPREEREVKRDSSGGLALEGALRGTPGCWRADPSLKLHTDRDIANEAYPSWEDLHIESLRLNRFASLSRSARCTQQASTKGSKNDIQHEWKMPKSSQQELRLELLASSEWNLEKCKGF